MTVLSLSFKYIFKIKIILYVYVYYSYTTDFFESGKKFVKMMMYKNIKILEYFVCFFNFLIIAILKVSLEIFHFKLIIYWTVIVYNMHYTYIQQ